MFESRIIWRVDVAVAVRIREDFVVAFAAVEVERSAIVLFARERGRRVDFVSADWILEETGHFGLRERIRMIPSSKAGQSGLTQTVRFPTA